MSISATKRGMHLLNSGSSCSIDDSEYLDATADFRALWKTGSQVVNILSTDLPSIMNVNSAKSLDYASSALHQYVDS